MRKTAQEIAQDTLGVPTWKEDVTTYIAALKEIAALPSPVSVPFALPVDATSSMRVSAVDCVTKSDFVDDGVTLWRNVRAGSMDKIAVVRPPCAAAWLSLFNVPEKEESK